MTIETPENNEALEQSAPVDQTGPIDATPDRSECQSLPTAGAVTLSAIVSAHEGSHPGFDPAIHAVADDGTPKRRADGSYALKRGRKSGHSNSLPPKTGATATAIKTDSETVTDNGPVKIAPDEMARQSANMVVNLAVWVCGEEIGAPKDKAEADGLKMSFVNYYEARGVPNIPPELGLVIALGSYIGPRVTKSEKAKGFIERSYIWIRTKVGK